MTPRFLPLFVELAFWTNRPLAGANTNRSSENAVMTNVAALMLTPK